MQEYNFMLFKIVFVLCLFREIMTENTTLEKTITPFHARDIISQQQYKEKKFTKFSELISWFLVMEQNNEPLIQNH